MSLISNKLIPWHHKYGRHNLPWQKTKSPYAIWISEIMLQQTQVKTVMNYYEKFMKKFPTIQILAKAKEDEVLRSWSGLGYYARARNLHNSAKIIYEKFDGIFPENDMKDFLNIVNERNTILVAHNAQFDVKRFNQTIQAHNIFSIKANLSKL